MTTERKLTMSNQKLLQLTPQDLRNIIQLAHNAGYLKSKKENNIINTKSNSWIKPWINNY